jgi:hypothetical protein
MSGCDRTLDVADRLSLLADHVEHVAACRRIDRN